MLTVWYLKYGLYCWKGIFRAHETENDKRLNVLFCCLEGLLFPTCVI